MSSLVEKQKGEEAAYFRREEEAKIAALRASFEKIITEAEDSALKQEVLQVLGKQETTSFVSRLGALGDWKIGIPISLFLIIPAISNEVIVINEETQLLACFMLFCGTLYNQAGPMWHKYCEDQREAEFKIFQKADERLLSSLEESVKLNEKVIHLEETVTEFHAVSDSLAVVQADLLNDLEQHKFRDLVAKRLSTLVAIEDAASNAIRQRMLTKVRADVTATFSNDKKAKESALAQAIAVLTSGGAAKYGKDIVGDAFKTSLKDYRDAYSKLPAGGDEILVQLEKDIAEAVKLPSFGSADAGNVYLTHPLPGLSK